MTPRPGQRLKLLVLPDPDAVARWIAGRITGLVAERPTATLGLATGETARPIYRRLVEKHRRGLVSFKSVRSFNIDEYVGLPPDHPGSFASFMRETLFEHVDLDPARAHLPLGSAVDLAEEARRYERAIAEAGGIDFQILGIGANGHIGFNEPGSEWTSRTRVVTLARSTREANAASFPDGEEVPERAITMGIGTLLEASEIVLAATGSAKAAAVACALEGPASPGCPAAALRSHPNATILCDREASADLKRSPGVGSVPQAR